MRLIFIRHGDPDYVNDTLTEKGWREARLLSERVKSWDIDAIYLSPLGRAQDTASFSLKELGMQGITLDWLREFWYPVTDPVTGRFGVPWDFMPEFFTKEELLYDKDHWFEHPILASNETLKANALAVFQKFDELLASYGYVRDGGLYRVNTQKKAESDTTIVFFCHLGVSLLLLGHLFGISPSILWQSIFLAPTSVTILSSEERMENTAFFRAQVLGDTRHLFDGREPISQAGYFTEPFLER